MYKIRNYNEKCSLICSDVISTSSNHSSTPIGEPKTSFEFITKCHGSVDEYTMREISRRVKREGCARRGVTGTWRHELPIEDLTTVARSYFCYNFAIIATDALLQC
jgi:hypothetical protein